jgi:endo-alpha-1,4-polygalactosaminidase (GH114 family)
MKKLAYFLSVMFLMAAFMPAATAKTTKKEKPELTEEQQLRLDEIENRVEEIKAMDFSDMSKEERKEMRDELREMKKEAKEIGGGVYLSVGAIIIILLILILIT